MTCMDASLALRHSALTADRLPIATGGVQSHENRLPIWVGKAGGAEVPVCRCECCVRHPTIQIQVTAVRQQQAFHAPGCQTLRMTKIGIVMNTLQKNKINMQGMCQLHLIHSSQLKAWLTISLRAYTTTIMQEHCHNGVSADLCVLNDPLLFCLSRQLSV